MNRKLSKSEMITVSLMLFGMFFGAGNLIFPPMLGKLAGKNVIISLIFFSITAVVFPILGILSVAKTDGLNNLTKKVSPMFALIFPMLIYLSIGPGLGIPRAATVPFEMAFKPYLPNSFNVNLARFLYTCIFFGLAFWLALNPKKIVKRSGKILAPVLLTLITVLFVGVLFKNPNMAIQPVEKYASAPQIKGFLEGYNTMDTIAALNFGLVISLAIKTMKIENKKDVLKYTMKGGLAAGTCLFLVYAMLSFIGYTTAGLFEGTKNGADILTLASRYVYGSFGAILLATIFTLACLTTCIGLITSVSQYFYELTNKMSYKKWVLLWSLTALVVSNFGLNAILKLAVPVLSAIYPASIMLIILSFAEKIFNGSNFVYKMTTYTTVVISLAYTAITIAEKNKVSLGVFSKKFKVMPLYSEGLVWVIPAFLVMGISALVVNYGFIEKTNITLEGEA